jgi:hypothetical protein
MGVLDRLRALLGIGGPPQTEYDDVLDDRILSSPGEREQQAVTTEGEREARLDEGRPPLEPER